MNFFESQAQAKVQTTRLLILFGAAVITLIVITNIFVMAAFGFIELEDQGLTLEFIKNQFDWNTFGFVAILVSMSILIGSAFKIHSLSSGGKVIAKSLGGSLVSHSNGELKTQTLLNVVEEMAIASGTPVPEVYILNNESGINAFAAGFTIDDAVIGVTQGALDYFTREELQGVIAHEFSHIVHGDMRLNMRLVGVLHGILSIGQLGHDILNFTNSDRRSGSGQVLAFGIGLMVIGYSGTFFGNMIKASISRQREYLADASAVQYTRNRYGIANALLKIGGYSKGSCLDTGQAPAMSHAYFSNGIKSKLQSVFATHPPIELRVKAIDPSWQGVFPEVTLTSKDNLKSEASSGFMAASATSRGVVNSVGQLTVNNIEKAKKCLAAMPTLVKENVYSIEGATATIYGLLLAKMSDMDTLNKQMQYLENSAPKPVMDKLHLMTYNLQNLGTELRLPLVEIALPQLRQLNKIDYLTILNNMKWLIEADNKLEIFEWSIERVVGHYLKSAFEVADYKIVKYHSMQAVKAELEIIMSVLCENFVDENDYLSVTMSAKNIVGVADIDILPKEMTTMNSFTLAVDKLALLKPRLKEKVIQFCYFLVTQDQEYSVYEQETIRALADSMGCPIPIE